MIKRKIAYNKLTFFLSVIGFMGSVGFYYGVLREVYGSANQKALVEELKQENKLLKESLNIITQKKNCE